MSRKHGTDPRALGLLFVAALLASPAGAQDEGELIEFDSGAWQIERGRVQDHLDRQAFFGSAFLEDLEFENGVIEVDVAVDGRRSYPGIVFRRRSAEDFEHFYIRPHRASLYPDALQYAPTFNGVSTWQLHHGAGCTAGATLSRNEWIHLRLEVHGAQARVFLNNSEQAALEIHDLKHGVTSGGIGLSSPLDGSAFFSNFRFRLDDSLEFDAAPKVESSPEWLTDWEISTPFPAARIDPDVYPGFFPLFAMSWQPIEVEPPGLVNVSRQVKRGGQAPDCILARTTIRSDEDRRVKLSFGYSDEVTIFHNARPVFTGNSAYQSRDRSFTGVIGLNDAVYLDLKKGLNEIFLILRESFGGWGFMAKLDRRPEAPRKDHSRVELLWETPRELVTPESVQYDAERDVLYVTSFDRLYQTRPEPSGFISKLNLLGEIVELKWITGLVGPCGMGLYQDTLYVAERGNLVEIDVPSGELRRRHPIPGSVFLNDVACDGAGNVYVSDSFPPTPENRVVIYRMKGGELEPWIEDSSFGRVNGLFVDGDRLLVGNTEDGTLRSIELASRRVEVLGCFGAGVVDGIRVTQGEGTLVSRWDGPTFLLSPTGDPVEILNPRQKGWNVADFEYVSSERMIVAPTFSGDRVVAYELK